MAERIEERDAHRMTLEAEKADDATAIRVFRAIAKNYRNFGVRMGAASAIESLCDRLELANGIIEANYDAAADRLAARPPAARDDGKDAEIARLRADLDALRKWCIRQPFAVGGWWADPIRNLGEYETEREAWGALLDEARAALNLDRPADAGRGGGE